MSFLSRLFAAFNRPSRRKQEAATAIAAAVRKMQQDYQADIQANLNKGLFARPYGASFTADAKVPSYRGDIDLRTSATNSVFVLRLVVCASNRASLRFARNVVSEMATDFTPFPTAPIVDHRLNTDYAFTTFITGITGYLAEIITEES